jgi:hypothetical protein
LPANPVSPTIWRFLIVTPKPPAAIKTVAINQNLNPRYQVVITVSGNARLKYLAVARRSLNRLPVSHAPFLSFTAPPH